MSTASLLTNKSYAVCKFPSVGGVVTPFDSVTTAIAAGSAKVLPNAVVPHVTLVVDNQLDPLHKHISSY